MGRKSNEHQARKQPIKLTELDAALVRAAEGDIAKMDLTTRQVIESLNTGKRKAIAAKDALWQDLAKRYKGLNPDLDYVMQDGTLYVKGTEPQPKPEASPQAPK